MSGSVVSDTLSDADPNFGFGVLVGPSTDTLQSSTAVIETSVIANSTNSAVAQLGGTLSIDRTVLHGTHTTVADLGSAIACRSAQVFDERGVFDVRDSVIQQSSEVAVLAIGCQAALESTRVRDTLPGIDDRFGRGVELQTEKANNLPADATINSSIVERSYDFGIVSFGANASLQRSVVFEVAPRVAGGIFGDGVATRWDGASGAFAIDDSLIAHASRAGFAAFGSVASLSSSTFECDSINLAGDRVDGTDFDFQDGGDNQCECGEQRSTCQVLTIDLQPPEQPGT
jgi:hypothetical protein